MFSSHKHEVARLQSDFYRNQYYKILTGLIISGLIILLLIALIIYHLLFTQPATYYASTTTGRILPMMPAH